MVELFLLQEKHCLVDAIDVDLELFVQFVDHPRTHHWPIHQNNVSTASSPVEQRPACYKFCDFFWTGFIWRRSLNKLGLQWIRWRLYFTGFWFFKCLFICWFSSCLHQSKRENRNQFFCINWRWRKQNNLNTIENWKWSTPIEIMSNIIAMRLET